MSSNPASRPSSLLVHYKLVPSRLLDGLDKNYTTTRYSNIIICSSVSMEIFDTTLQIATLSEVVLSEVNWFP